MKHLGKKIVLNMKNSAKSRMFLICYPWHRVITWLVAGKRHSLRETDFPGIVVIVNNLISFNKIGALKISCFLAFTRKVVSKRGYTLADDAQDNLFSKCISDLLFSSPIRAATRPSV